MILGYTSCMNTDQSNDNFTDLWKRSVHRKTLWQ